MLVFTRTGGGSLIVTILVDGKEEEVEVDLAGATIVRAGERWPIRILQNGTKVELEVAGERLMVEGWPEGLAVPPGPVNVNGEVVTFELRTRRDSRTAPVRSAAAVGPPVGPSATPVSSNPSDGVGVAVVPPMPGKVIEVRVREGDRVTAGQVVLVLEAMKMRNEVPAPAAGRVSEVRVTAGSNVRAREPMLRILVD